MTEDVKNPIGMRGSEVSKESPKIIIEGTGQPKDASDNNNYVESEDKWHTNQQSKASKIFALLKENSRGIIIFVVSFIFISASLMWIEIMNNNITWSDRLVNKPENFNFYNTYTVGITLLGDSLINKPYHMFNLVERMRKQLPATPFISFYNEGENGNTISMILDRLPQALAHNAAGLILLWDSDVSNVDESTMNSTEIASTREAYMNDLRQVLQDTIAYGTDVIAVAGPNLLGERPWDSVWASSVWYWDKVQMLNDYRAMNIEVCAEYNVTYINSRMSFLHSVPKWWFFPRWWITIDGEHENSRGTGLIVDLFVEQIQNWLVEKGYPAK